MPHYEVGSVFAGSDAAGQGLAVGTDVLTIDGASLEGLRVDAANELLLGAAGTTKAVETPSGAVQVAVEDLLAP
jgi:C-terminal processing protease CtpA/Prc